MYELRPVKPAAQMLPLVKQFIENYMKNFGEAPSGPLVQKWCAEMVQKQQEFYVKNYLEGYAIQDIRPFGGMVAGQFPIAETEMKLTDKKKAVL